MQGNNTIVNCQFVFKCPRQWDELEITDDPDQKYCHQCNRFVYFARTQTDLSRLAQEAKCIAAYVVNIQEVSPKPLLGEPVWEEPGVNLYLEPIDHLNPAQLKAIQKIVQEELNLLQLRLRYSDGQRHLLAQNLSQSLQAEIVMLLSQLNIPYSLE
jgi:hypothetical protein